MDRGKRQEDQDLRVKADHMIPKLKDLEDQLKEEIRVIKARIETIDLVKDQLNTDRMERTDQTGQGRQELMDMVRADKVAIQDPMDMVKADHRDSKDVATRVIGLQDLQINRVHARAHIRIIEDHMIRRETALMDSNRVQDPMELDPIALIREDLQATDLVLIQDQEEKAQVKDLIATKEIIRDRRVVREVANKEADIIQEALNPLIRMRMISQHTLADQAKEDHSPKEGVRERILIKRFLIKR